MNQDTINRIAAIEAVCSVCGDTECKGYFHQNPRKFFCPEPYALVRLSSAEATKSKWIPATDGSDRRTCGICYNYAPSFKDGSEYLSSYCPECGAYMEKA